jgi:uncharacterized membrane protein YkvA (DUF1232 family)
VRSWIDQDGRIEDAMRAERGLGGAAARRTGRAAAARYALGLPGVARVKELARIVPELGKLFMRLGRDRRVPALWRLALIVLGAYLVSPIDLIPDFLPGIGQLDDAAIAAVVLRAVVRAAGPDVVSEHWPGTKASLNVVLRLAGYP